jgi:hypothetical protein
MSQQKEKDDKEKEKEKEKEKRNVKPESPRIQSKSRTYKRHKARKN